MIDNSDIFDEADLLAIANDDESSSASVSSSSSKSSLAMTSQCHVDSIYNNNNSHNNNDGAARGNNGKDVTKNDNLNDNTINNNDGNTTTNFLGDDKHKHKGKDSQSVDSSICNDYGFGTETKNGTSSTRSNGSDNDDDDDDVADDFLKSWLDTETKNTAKTNAPSILAPHPHDEDGKENRVKGHGNSGDEIQQQQQQQQQQHHQLSPQIQACHDETRNDNNLDKKHEQADSAPLNNNHGASSNDNSNDDNSSDDDENNYGFLESWSKPSNKKEKSPSETTNEEVVVAVPPLTETTPDHTAQQQEETDGNFQNNQINIHVGTSTMQWVSQYKSAKEQQQSMNHQGGRNSKGRKKVQRDNGESTTTTNASYYEHGGVVAIQNYKRRGRVNDDQVSVMCLKTLSSKRKYNNDAKKSKYGSSAVTEVAVTLESVHSPEEERVTSSGGLQQQQYYGQAVFAPEVDKTLPGTMVDCLARYDSETGCYVLEIVDLTVSNLMPQSSIGADYRTSSSDAIRKQRFGRHNVQNSNNDGVVEESGAASLTTSKSTMLDPRVRAKRAQDQVHRRLKRGKGKLGGGAGAGAQSKKQQKSVASAPDDGGGKMDVAKTANHPV